ncbi:hypothetical protein [Kallotenue papyrolyticum]|uniref:hypothetical protein n=1 Tax=Kallotenue papyrolyticum TaxID=1325125 RepID=UPI001268F1EB|nr:hypothetical protein [Kallotenue papyrolyticum]
MLDIKSLYKQLVAIAFLTALLVGCTEQPVQRFTITPAPATPALTQDQAGYPAPSTTPATTTGYPASSEEQRSQDGRSQSALDSYRIAADIAAREFDPAARLYAIVPSRIMIANLGGPPVLPGWFYRFKVPGQRRQFIVQIVDGEATGTTLAEPVEETSPKEQPIDLQKVKLDSNQVFDKFQEFAKKRNIPTEESIYDLELVYLEGSSGPVWSVVDSRSQTWIYSIDATTGDEVANPHQKIK